MKLLRFMENIMMRRWTYFVGLLLFYNLSLNTSYSIHFIKSPWEGWDYMITNNQWITNVSLDGTVMSSFERNRFSMRFDDLGIKTEDGFYSFIDSELNFDNPIIIRNTIVWKKVYPGLHIQIQHEGSQLKIKTVLSESLLYNLKNDYDLSLFDAEDQFTFRFEVEQFNLIDSQVKDQQGLLDIQLSSQISGAMKIIRGEEMLNRFNVPTFKVETGYKKRPYLKQANHSWTVIEDIKFYEVGLSLKDFLEIPIGTLQVNQSIEFKHESRLEDVEVSHHTEPVQHLDISRDYITKSFIDSNVHVVPQSISILGGGTKLYADKNGDRKRTVVCRVDPPIPDVLVRFSIMDPDDTADYPMIDPNGDAGADNVMPDSALYQYWIYTDEFGTASTTFQTKSKVGGDNFQIRAEVNETSIYTDTLTVWRKLLIEYDVMEDTPVSIVDHTKIRSHQIHHNYLYGRLHGLRAIFEAFNDGLNRKNRNTFLTPIITMDSIPLQTTLFSEFVKNDSQEISVYNEKTWNNRNKLHLISAHLWETHPKLDSISGFSNQHFSYIFWEKMQYESPDIDSGLLENIWIIAHELGHSLGRKHHLYHSDDDVYGASGHDCIMTQSEESPGLNVSGQFTKRFGMACVRAIRSKTMGMSGLH